MRLQQALCLTVWLMLTPAVSMGQEGEPAASDTVLEQAVSEAQQGRTAEAIALLEAARDQGETDTRVLTTLAALYVESGKFTQASKILIPLANLPSAGPEVFYLAGRAAAALGRRDDAVRYFERSIEGLPGSPATRELGFLRLADGELSAAYLRLRPWCWNHPDDFPARLAAVSCAVALERAAEAEEMLGDLPQDDPRVKLLWGRAMLLKGDGWGALALAKPLAESAPPAMAAQVTSVLAEAFLTIEQPDSAIEELDGKLGDDPHLAHLLSRAYERRGESEQALAVLEPAAQSVLAKVGSESSEADRILGVEVVLDYGLMLAAAQRQSEAIPISSAPPNWSPKTQRLGELWSGSRGCRPGGGGAVGAVPRRGHPHRRRSILGDRAGRERHRPHREDAAAGLESGRTDRSEEALRVLRDEQTLMPGDVRPVLLEARLLSDLGRSQEALAAAERAVQTAPDNSDANYLRGVSRLNLGQQEAGEGDLRRAIDLSPQHTAALNDLAVLLMVRGESEEARLLLERVLAIRPEDPVATANLQRLEEK